MLIATPSKETHTYVEDSLITRCTSNCAGYFAYIYRNCSNQNELVENAQCQTKNLRILSPYSGEQFEVKVKRGEIVLVKFQIGAENPQQFEITI